MNDKENSLRIIRFDHPERIVPWPPCHGICYHGCNHEGYEGGGHEMPVGSKWVDIWGTVWHKEHEGVMGFPRGFPLAEPSALKTYRWPDPDDPRLVQKIYDSAQAFTEKDAKFLAGSHRDTIWEKSYMLVGMENMMVYFLTEPDYAREILHHIMDFQLGIARHYLKLGVEMIHCSDDLGTQIAPLLGPDLVRDFLVPEYRQLFELYRRHRVLIDFHSCGNIDTMIPIFLDLGINILNPVQATANNLDQVRALTQGKLALQGGVSSATMMTGPREKIVAEIRQRMNQLGRNGGYFCAPDQGLPFPQEHWETLHDAVKKYGRYPLE